MGGVLICCLPWSFDHCPRIYFEAEHRLVWGGWGGYRGINPGRHLASSLVMNLGSFRHHSKKEKWPESASYTYRSTCVIQLLAGIQVIGCCMRYNPLLVESRCSAIKFNFERYQPKALPRPLWVDPIFFCCFWNFSGKTDYWRRSWATSLKQILNSTHCSWLLLQAE